MNNPTPKLPNDVNICINTRLTVGSPCILNVPNVAKCDKIIKYIANIRTNSMLEFRFWLCLIWNHPFLIYTRKRLNLTNITSNLCITYLFYLFFLFVNTCSFILKSLFPLWNHKLLLIGILSTCCLLIYTHLNPRSLQNALMSTLFSEPIRSTQLNLA